MMTRTLLLLTLATTPLAAQRHRSGHDDDQSSHMAQMQEMMAPMMGAMTFAPEHLLARKDSLALTPQQVTRLTALGDAARAAHDAASADAKTHMSALAAAWQAAAPDTVALKTHFAAAHEAMGKAHWAMLSAAAQARGVLTNEQRARVEGWVSTKREHGDEHHN
jgi:Spy/CpxP family protein refolding chaperone